MEFEKVIRSRESARKFCNKEIEQEKLDKILEAGRLAPTAKNVQPIKIYVVKSEEGIKKIDKATPCRYEAPIVLMVCGDSKESDVKDGMPFYQMDASIVTTHMMLEATNVGIDSVWVEFFDSNMLKEEFNLPKNIIPVALLPIGYKSKQCPPSSMHEIRKKIEDIVEYK